MDEPIYIRDLRRIGRSFEALSNRERKILGIRFGFIDGKFHSLEETGKEIGVSRERIRQVESKCLEKLRLLYSLLNWK